MSLLAPRLLARPTSSATSLFSALSLSSSSSSPGASSSRRSYSAKAEEELTPHRITQLSGTGETWGDSPEQPRIMKMRKPNIYTSIVPTHPVGNDWKRVNSEIQSHFPKQIVGTHIFRPIPEPKAPIDTPDAFFAAIGRGIGAKVKAKAPELTWTQLFKYKTEQWKDTVGLDIPDRKYVMNCTEKYRLGYDPRQYATIPKAPKKFRRHGLAVQDGLRMKWSTTLDIRHARKPWGMKAVVKIKRDD